MDARLQLSVIVPLYNEAGVIGVFWGALQDALAQLDVEPELILVDDGSVDDTWHQISALADGRQDVLLLRFSRNFGKENAITAGMKAATPQPDMLWIVDRNARSKASIRRALRRQSPEPPQWPAVAHCPRPIG